MVSGVRTQNNGRRILVLVTWYWANRTRLMVLLLCSVSSEMAGLVAGLDSSLVASLVLPLQLKFPPRILMTVVRLVGMALWTMTPLATMTLAPRKFFSWFRVVVTRSW